MPNYRGLNIPKVSFGKVDSDALFGALDQEVFDFYERNKDRYKRALDIGANIGVHAVQMGYLGWHVKAYEPDPFHFDELLMNRVKHGSDISVDLCEAAVSNRSGRSTFVHVSNNTTGSHLDGEKLSYGPTERFEVDLVDCRPLFSWADFAKVDCEGHEATILECVTGKNCEFMVEVSNAENAKRIYEHFSKLGMGMWAQGLGWGRVQGLEDVPNHHSRGHLFIGNNKP